MVRNITERLSEIDGEIASAKGTFMAFCKKKAGDRKDILTEAKARGVNTRALKVEIKAGKLEAKAASLRDDLDPDDQHDAEAIRKAIGEFADTPLGGAAVSKADKKAAEQAADKAALAGLN
ncbi:MAG: hypothetical protein DI527_00375 [Chelatococcus sp.]|nr:MAG: hypothetical protein DI527_00375 [Chelatococcus sp.]